MAPSSHVVAHARQNVICSAVAAVLDGAHGRRGMSRAVPTLENGKPGVTGRIEYVTARKAMNYVNLGTSGLRVSRICLGMMSFGNNSERQWVIDEDAAEPIVKTAVEGGVTFFDTADTYSGGASEVATGKLVSKYLTRDEAVIATKVFMPMTPGENGGGLSRKARPVGHRRLAVAAVDGLRRSLPNSPLGPAHAN